MRQALALLEAAGAVWREAGRGTVLRDIGPDGAGRFSPADVVRIRQLLEPLAVKLAVDCPAAPPQSDAQRSRRPPAIDTHPLPARELRAPALRAAGLSVSVRQRSGCRPYRGRGKPASQQDANRAHAQLKTWRILRKLRCCPWRAGQLAKAIHVLQARELRMKKAHCFGTQPQPCMISFSEGL